MSSSLIRRDPVLIKLASARQSLAIAQSIQETKRILDVAVAAEIYAKRQQLGIEAENYCLAIKIEALARLGELLRDIDKAKGGKRVKGSRGQRGRISGSRMEPLIDAPTLATLLNLPTAQAKKVASIAQRLASLSSKERQKIIDRETTIASAVQTQQRVERHKASPMAMAAGAFQVLLADPPWSYRNSGLAQSAESQYKTMSTESISSMTLPKLLDDSVCFLWATSPLLPDAIEVMKAWRFEYKASLVWVKDRAPGIGWFCHTKHEFVLIGTTGQAQPAELVDSVFSAPVGRHSGKPDSAYGIIERMYPTWRRVEMFARHARDGWSSWGDQLDVH